MHKDRSLQNYIVISDFDGTISTVDTNDYLFNNFGTDENKAIEHSFKRGEIGNREGMTNHFDVMKITEKEYENIITENIGVDYGFDELLSYLHDKKIEFHIVSGGFKNAIKALLHNFTDRVQGVSANELKFHEKDIEVIFNTKIESTHCGKGKCGNCKVNLISHHIFKGKKVIFIGDGLTDFCGAKYASIVFAKNELKDHLLKHKIAHFGYDNFSDVLHLLKEILD